MRFYGINLRGQCLNKISLNSLLQTCNRVIHFGVSFHVHNEAAN